MIRQELEDLKQRIREVERRLLLVEKPVKKLSEIDDDYLERKRGCR